VFTTEAQKTQSSLRASAAKANAHIRGVGPT
jgi:hypothetical protein